jgi:hypothetical protein
MAIDENNILYTADQQRIFRHDTRTSDGPTLQFQTLSEISHLAVRGTSICVTTLRNGITISDGRELQRTVSESQIDPNPPICCDFAGPDHLICCYKDSKVISWNFKTEENEEFELPKLLTLRKLPPLAISSFILDSLENVAVIYESGISTYVNGALQSHSGLGQKSKFGTMSYAPCFGRDYVIAVVDDCSLLPCRIGGETTTKPLTFHGAADICSVSANNLMICLAEQDDEGYLAAIMPEAFDEQFF